jgi:hypothetical protein
MLGAERQHPRRPAMRQRQLAQKVERRRRHRRRVAVHGHHPHMHLPDPRLEPAHEHLIGERHVQVRPRGRRQDRVRQPGQRRVQMRGHRIAIESL